MGGLIGLEREFNDQPAGFRTHILVTLGAALFTIAGAYGPAFSEAGPDSIRFDPTRVAAQVVTGIGFLGAGAILRRGVNVRGLTTAASIWVTAAIGVAVGLGYWVAAFATTTVALLSLLLLKPLEHALVTRSRSGVRKLVIDLDPSGSLAAVTERLEARGIELRSVKIVGSEGTERELMASVWVPSDIRIDEVINELSEVAGVTDVDLSR